MVLEGKSLAYERADQMSVRALACGSRQEVLSGMVLGCMLAQMCTVMRGAVRVRRGTHLVHAQEVIELVAPKAGAVPVESCR